MEMSSLWTSFMVDSTLLKLPRLSMQKSIGCFEYIAFVESSVLAIEPFDVDPRELYISSPFSVMLNLTASTMRCKPFRAVNNRLKSYMMMSFMIEYYNILAAIVKQLLLLWHFLAIAAGFFYAIDICQALSLLALLDSISS